MTINYEKRVAELEGVIAAALAALDEGRRGDVRRILKTGHDRPVLSSSVVLTKEMGR